MIILGLDTSGPDCSVSIVDEAAVRVHISQNIIRGHAETLAGMVEQAFQTAGLSPADIDRLAVCTGPGSFTGLRVAISFAKGFALPRALPVVGIDALEITAQEAWLRDGKENMFVYRDIRRGEVFCGEFNSGKPAAALVAISSDDVKARSEGLFTIETGSADTRILAWLAMDRNPADYPADPVYSRGPDAKLPGGKASATPKA